MLAARTLWRELGLDSTLDQLARRDRRDVVRLSDRALVLVANRLTAPGSEHALVRWLETDFVCDRIGRRFIVRAGVQLRRFAAGRSLVFSGCHEIDVRAPRR